MSSKLKEFAPIFRPRSHAVVGASADVTKFGGRFLRVLLAFGYPGKLYPVNPHESDILGLKTFPHVADIPEAVEFATITTPAPTVPAIVEECLAKGIKAVQILSSGFREIGPKGQRLEEQITRTAARGIRVIGPNCFGVYSPAGGLTILPGGGTAQRKWHSCFYESKWWLCYPRGKPGQQFGDPFQSGCQLW